MAGGRAAKTSLTHSPRSSTAPGERGGSIQLLDLPLEADGLNAESMAQLRAMVGGDGGIAELARAKKAALGGGGGM